MKKESKKKIDKQWLVLSVIAILILVVVAILVVLQNNNKNEEELTTENATESVVQNDELNPVDENSEVGIAVEKTASEYLDAFVSCDFDLMKSLIHEDDAPFFNFDSESQVEFYKAIFPKVSYEIESLWEKDGVYGALTTITAPSMTQALGDIHLQQLDKVVEGNTDDNMTIGEVSDLIIKKVKSGDLPLESFSAYVIVQYENGEYIPRCNEYVANALLGGYPEASLELANTVSESVNALNGNE